MWVYIIYAIISDCLDTSNYADSLWNDPKNGVSQQKVLRLRLCEITKFSFHENTFENAMCQTSSILFRTRCVRVWLTTNHTLELTLWTLYHILWQNRVNNISEYLSDTVRASHMYKYVYDRTNVNSAIINTNISINIITFQGFSCF